MTIDSYINTCDSISVEADDNYIDGIMTEDNQMRLLGKPKQDKDPNALKLASFRTKEGVWAEFCQKADSINLTATDVLKAAMDQFISGEYDPRAYAPSRRNDDGLNHHDVKIIVDQAISEALAKLDLLGNETIAPLAESLSELEAYTHGQFKTIREELQQAVISRRSQK